VLSQAEPRDAAVNFDTRIESYNKSIMERLCIR